MKLVQTLLALSLAGVMMAQAHADTIFTMPLPLSSTPYINTNTVSAGAVFTLSTTGATTYNFTDTYNFSVVGSPTAAATAVTVNLDLGSLSFHISDLKLDLFDAGNTWLAGNTPGNPLDVSVSLASPLSDGNYYFKVRGLADGVNTNQGIYTFTAAAVPVPEPESYMTMLAGLGLIGFVVLRRNTR